MRVHKRFGNVILFTMLILTVILLYLLCCPEHTQNIACAEAIATVNTTEQSAEVRNISRDVVYKETLDANDVATYNFSSVDYYGEYYFAIEYAAMYSIFQVEIIDNNNTEIEYTEVTLPAIGDDITYGYAVKFNVGQGVTYSINASYFNPGAQSLQISVKISPWREFSTIKLGDETIYSNGVETGRNHVYLGEKLFWEMNYKNTAPQGTEQNWRLNDITTDDLVLTESDSLTIINNEQNLGETIKVDVWDCTGIYTLTLFIKRPAYAVANFESTTYNYQLQFYDSYGAVIDASASGFKSMEVIIGAGAFPSITTTNPEYNIIRVPFFEAQTTVGAVVEFEWRENKYYQNLAPTTVNNYVININDYNTANVTGDHTRVVVLGAASNKTITTTDKVKALFFVENSSTEYFNLKINLQSTDNVFLYLNGIKIQSTNASSSVIVSEATTLTISVNNNNSISGKATTALINSNELIFTGTGSLTVVGANGADGSNGKGFLDISVGERDGRHGQHGQDAENGTSAVLCTDLSLAGNCSITLKGGNGGNGGKGNDGEDGFAGQHYGTYTLAYDGGIGGDGGNGGDGGDAGLGCNQSAEGIIIEDGLAGWGGSGGSGGNGGNGINAVEYIYKSPAKNYGIKDSSKGGDGGDGGDAGSNGNGILRNFTSSLNTVGYGGDGGDGGRGGNGESLRKNHHPVSDRFVYSNAKNGGNGGNGGAGYYGGNGGDGGDGGQGAKGFDGSLFYECGPGQPGGNGGNGGDGGNYLVYSDDCAQGGAGGTGGQGGAPGDAVIASKRKGPGANGINGTDGANGIYEGEPACVAAGTLITLADGRQVPVESLTGNELLLVWNLFTGKFDVAPILFIDSEVAGIYEVITLTFSDGTTLKVIDEHALWDFDLNEYVFIRSDAAKYIGHWFNKQTYDADGNMVYTRVQLTGVTVTEEYTSAWSPVTYGHLCFYVNGMLSMPGATTGLINIFEVDPDTLTIDEEQYLADIEMYGLFTYEEFAALYLVPEEIFDAFGGQYLKVAMGKGLLTEDMISILINRYSEFFV